MSRPEKVRFWERVEKSKGCWNWIGKRDTYGYGKIFDKNNRSKKAHRLSYELNIGPIGDNFVLHHCDNPSCVNPKHLYLGTQSENIHDEIRRKRNRYMLSGSQHPNARFTKEDILKICSMRKEGKTQLEISKKMKTTQQSISRIISGKRYAEDIRN